MSKRRNSTVNIPAETLERARKQAGLNPESDGTESESVSSATMAELAPRRKKVNTAQLERKQRKGELTHEMVQEILAHPTKFVTEEELHQDYQHVLVDLRNMGLLSAVLMILLVVLAQFI